MHSSCMPCLRAEGDEGFAAARSGTVYRRYLRKFICVIPRVHGGYFKSSLRVIQREFIGTYCSSSGSYS